ncbi:MAG: hypothetical protein L6437_03755 [Kiritimatiellae bacterium]|nr:hypothetical protein [Verrucomicrobiota bacterium]MCG2659346.1 hypothetical protein [Kiritimatiellia bacterium]
MNLHIPFFTITALGLLIAGTFPTGAQPAVTADPPARMALGNADFDGDGLADPTQADPAEGLWTICLSAFGYPAAQIAFGGPTTLSFAADYDGDRQADPGIFDTAVGAWTVKLSTVGYISVSLSFTETNAIPVAADFDGDAKADPAVYQPDTGRWVVRLSAADYFPVAFLFGAAGDIPIVGDYDGDTKADPAVYGTASGTWSVMLSSLNYFTVTLKDFGGTGLAPVPADYDGDRRTDPAIYTAASGAWAVLLSGADYAPTTITEFGGSNATAVAGDYDGDAKADPAVYDPTAGTLSARFSSGNYAAGSLRITNILQASATVKAAVYINEQTVALLYATNGTNYDYGNMRFQVVSHTGNVVSDEEVLYDQQTLNGSVAATMLLDANAQPHVFFRYYGYEVSHVYRTDSGWTNEAAGICTNGGNLLAARAGDGSFHLLLVVSAYSSTDTYAPCQYITNKRGGWESETFSVPKKWSMRLYGHDLAADTAGNAHLVLSFQDVPSQDVYWSGHLYYLSNQGGSWFMETVAEQAPGNNDACFWNPSVAVAPNGQPAVAAHLRFNVITGSDSLSELFCANRTAANQWNSAILADTADGYFGSDGGHFTGIDPTLAFDLNGGAHIIFSDLASSHIDGYESAVNGQIRYAHNADGTWHLTTLFRQSAAAWQGVRNKYLLLSPDGTGMDIITGLYPGSALVFFSNYRQSFFQF